MNIANLKILTDTKEPAEKKVSVVLLSEIKDAFFNPESRTEDIAALKDHIRQHGQLSPVALVRFPDCYRVADGHRRVRAHRELGEEMVYAYIYEPTDGKAHALLNEMFVKLNQVTRAFTKRDEFNVAMRGGPIFSQKIASDKATIELLFPDPAIRAELIKREITSTLISVSKKVSAFVLRMTTAEAQRAVKEKEEVFLDQWRTVLLYALKNRVQQHLISYMRARDGVGYDRGRLKDAIAANRPPPEVSSPKTRESWVY